MRKFFVMYFSLSSYLVYSTSLKMYKVEGSTTQAQSFCIISESFLGSRFFTMHALLLKKYTTYWPFIYHVHNIGILM